jgi:hypothetical protein
LNLIVRILAHSETTFGAGVREGMSNRTRIAITAAVALLLGADAYAYAFDHDFSPGLVRDLWFGPLQAIVYGVAIVGVFLVYRWWALIPALAPLAVEVYLHEMTDYVYPFHEDPYPVLVVFATPMVVVFLGVGLLLRALWEVIRPRLPGGSVSSPAP